ncbi:MAG: type 1 glutamine amidotransferase [Elusimicrobia bacterium]|nr:type 1 glutamine amidotransferase [Elusimicrobiota bacterium]
MNELRLRGKRVGILVEQQYQDLEVWYPALRLREEGAEVLFIGTGTATSYVGKYGYPVTVDTTAAKVAWGSLDALVIPGGWAPDFLRRDPATVQLVSRMCQAGKLVAAICHAGWLLASAKVLQGRTVTAFSAIKDDVVNAGARFVDQEVVVDGNLITARKPDDLPAFCRAIIQHLSQVPVGAEKR